jgi:hypothetical protein
MELIIIGFGLIYIISLIWNILTNKKDHRFFTAVLLTISAIIFVALHSSYENINVPTAMDVYQDKTTLEITYRDSIPIDTIVVLKPEFIKNGGINYEKI